MLNGKRAREENKLFFRWCLYDTLPIGESKSFKEFKEYFVYKKPKDIKEITEEQKEIAKQFSHGYKEVEYGNENMLDLSL